MEHLETFMDDFELLKLEIRLWLAMKMLPIKKTSRIEFFNGYHRLNKLQAGVMPTLYQDKIKTHPF